MSCRRHQHDLSACLDGRLPAGRRAQVMDHVDSCPRCAQVWEDLQSAQALVLGLEEPRVSPGFRDEVWSRIHAGEGAPEILLQEPISILTKVRYGAIGAAAAALVLVAFHFLVRNPGPVGDNPPDEGALVTELDPTDRARIEFGPGPLGSTDAPPPQLDAEPLTAAVLANHTVDEVTRAAKRLRLKRRAVLERPAETPTPVWVEVRRDVQTIGDGLNLLQNLERERLVEFGGHSRACMSEAQRYFIRAVDKDGIQRQEIQKLVQSLTLCPLEDLERNLRYTQQATLGDPQVFQRIQSILEQAEVRRFLNGRVKLMTAFPDDTSGTMKMQVWVIRPGSLRPAGGHFEVRTEATEKPR